MARAARPVFQHQGPATNCVIEGEALGWASCTAYSMAMGIDSATGGAVRPSGCKIRKLTGDKEKGLMLSQVAEVALEHYDIRVSVKTGATAISTASLIKQVRSGRGFVLQGNTSALPKKLQAGGPKPANHAVWVNEVRGDGNAPDEALVYDPAADGRREGIDKGPTWWAWDDLLAFAAALELDKHGRKLGPGRIYAGFIPAPLEEEVARHRADNGETLRATPKPAPEVTLRFHAVKTKPFPDRVRIDPPVAGKRVNIRSRPDRIEPRDVVDRARKGTLFVAFQKTKGATLEGQSIWYGNRRGTEWVHESGLRHVGGKT